MNIVLIGYRGTGKSTVSRILAFKLRRTLVKTDQKIVERAGVSIPRLVEQKGWEAFRRLEAEVVERVAQTTRDSVIDCGGGVVLNEENVRRLKQAGKTVLLTAAFETILKRIKNDPNRPPLKQGMTFEEEQRKILAEREARYNAAADLVFDTTLKRPPETAGEIMDRFQQEGWI